MEIFTNILKWLCLMLLTLNCFLRAMRWCLHFGIKYECMQGSLLTSSLGGQKKDMWGNEVWLQEKIQKNIWECQDVNSVIRRLNIDSNNYSELLGLFHYFLLFSRREPYLYFYCFMEPKWFRTSHLSVGSIIFLADHDRGKEKSNH